MTAPRSRATPSAVDRGWRCSPPPRTRTARGRATTADRSSWCRSTSRAWSCSDDRPIRPRARDHHLPAAPEPRRRLGAGRRVAQRAVFTGAGRRDPAAPGRPGRGSVAAARAWFLPHGAAVERLWGSSSSRCWGSTSTRPRSPAARAVAPPRVAALHPRSSGVTFCRMVYLPASWPAGRRRWGRRRRRCSPPSERDLRPALRERGLAGGARARGGDRRVHAENVVSPGGCWSARAGAVRAGRSARAIAADGARPDPPRGRGDESSICIGPINKVLNTVVWQIARPGGPEVEAHVKRLPDYLWRAPDGPEMQGYNSSELWDTAFAVQGILATGEVERMSRGRGGRATSSPTRCSRTCRRWRRATGTGAGRLAVLHPRPRVADQRLHRGGRPRPPCCWRRTGQVPRHGSARRWRRSSRSRTRTAAGRPTSSRSRMGRGAESLGRVLHHHGGRLLRRVHVGLRPGPAAWSAFARGRGIFPELIRG